MELLTFSSASNEYLPAISIMMLILTLGVYSLIFADRRKLPPITKESALQLIKIFTSGKGAPEFLLTKMRDVGKVFRLSMPEMTHWVVVCDPALARKILLEEEEKPDIYKRFDGFTGRVSTMFSKKTHGDDWHITRKGASTSFSMKSISSLLPIMYEKIGEMKSMLQRLDKEGTVFSLSEITTHLAMDFISAAMFNVDYRTMQSKSSEGRLLMHDMEVCLKEYALKQMINPFRFLMFWNTDVKEGKFAALRVEAAQKKLLDNYRETKTTSETAEDCAILGQLVRSPYRSDVERCADMTIFMVAGHETTAYTLAWIIIEVTRNPEVLERLKAEIDSAAPGVDDITQKQLNEMTYLDYVIKEGMRLWPVAALGAMRSASKDIPYKDFTIPKGTLISLPFFAIFRSDGIQDPDKFIPERWAPENPEAEKLKELYFPFSLGKRNCVGQNLASLETKLVLASVFKSFRFELKSSLEVDYFLTLKPVITVRVHSV